MNALFQASPETMTSLAKFEKIFVRLQEAHSDYMAFANFVTGGQKPANSVADYLVANLPKSSELIGAIARAVPPHLYPLLRASTPKGIDLHHPFEVWFAGRINGMRVNYLVPYEEMESAEDLSGCDNGALEEPPRVYGPDLNEPVGIETAVMLVLARITMTPDIAVQLDNVSQCMRPVRNVLAYLTDPNRDDDDDLDENNEALSEFVVRLRLTLYGLFDLFMKDAEIAESPVAVHAAPGLEPHPKTLDVTRPYAFAKSEQAEAEDRRREEQAKRERAERMAKQKEREAEQQVKRKRKELANAEKRAAQMKQKKKAHAPAGQ